MKKKMKTFNFLFGIFVGIAITLAVICNLDQWLYDATNADYFSNVLDEEFYFKLWYGEYSTAWAIIRYSLSAIIAVMLAIVVYRWGYDHRTVKIDDDHSELIDKVY